jgi:cell division protein FtsL
MGAAARKHADSGRMPAARPHLRLVAKKPRRSPASTRRARSGLPETLFRVCCTAMIVLAVVGLMRITFAVQATEAAIDAVQIQQDIRAEELQSKSLEADASALNAPSRVAAIADTALNMTEAGQVSYVTVSAAETTRDDATASHASGTSGGLGAILSSMMDVAAGEAQVLLVGDVGLSAR